MQREGSEKIVGVSGEGLIRHFRPLSAPFGALTSSVGERLG